MEIKDPTFAMDVNTTPRLNNNGGYSNTYNQSSNQGRGRGSNNRGQGRGSTPNQFSKYSIKVQEQGQKDLLVKYVAKLASSYRLLS